MKRIVLLLVVVALARAHPADASECFAIEDADRRSACLAAAKLDPSYCFKVVDRDARNACLGEAKADRYYCFKVEDADQRNKCLATTPRSGGSAAGALDGPRTTGIGTP